MLLKLILSFKGLIIILLIISVLTNIWFRHKLSQTEQKLSNVTTLTSNTMKEMEGIWSSKLQQGKELNDKLLDSLTITKEQINKLKSLISKGNETIKYVSEIKLQYDSLSFWGIGQQDTLNNESKTLRVSFSDTNKNARMYGYAEFNPPRYQINVDIPPIFVPLVMTEMKNNEYKLYVSTNNQFVEIESIEGAVVPYEKKSFLSKLGISSSIDIGWKKKNGVFIMGTVSIWRISPTAEIQEKGFDYGGKFSLFKW